MENYSELRRDFFFGVFCLAISVFLTWAITATIAERPSHTGITARTFPHIINILLFITGSILTAVSGLRLVRMDKSQKISSSPLLNREQLARLAIFVGLLIAYLVGLSTIGFLTSSIITIAAVHWVLGARNWLVIGLISVIGSTTVWYLFDKVMGVQFPEAFLL